MGSDRFSDINSDFLRILCLVLTLGGALALFISGAWLIGFLAVAIALFLYFSRALIGLSNRRIIFSLIISCLVIYMPLFTVWGWHIPAVLFGALALLLMLFLARAEFSGAYAIWLIVLFLLSGSVNFIQWLFNLSVPLWYVWIILCLTGALLVVRLILEKKKSY